MIKFVTIVISESKLEALAHYLMLEASTGHLMPDAIPAQDLSQTVVAAAKQGVKRVMLRYDKEVRDLLDTVSEEGTEKSTPGQ